MFREKHQISKSLALIIGLFCCLGFSSANTIKSSNLNSKLSLSISLNNPNSPNFQAQNFDEGKTKLVQAALTREQEQAIENFLKNNHYLHNIVQQQFTEYINLFLGIIGILGVLIPGSLLWFMYINSNKFKAEIKKKLEEELLFEFQKEVLELGGDISKLLGYMVVMENINLSSDLQFNPPSFETIHIVEQYPRILKYLQKKFRINSLPDIFHVKSGDALSFIGKYYVRKANSTDNEKLKEEARNNLDKSMEAYKKALELKPIEIEPINRQFWAEVLCKKGNTYAALGDYHKAISDYECALKIKDDYYWAYHSEGDAYTALGDYEKALEKYDRALKLPNISSAWLAETHYKEGIVFAKKDEDPDAIKCYNKSLEKNKSNSWVLHSLGDSYAKLGRKQEDYKLAIDNYKKAIDNYKKAYKNNPLQYQSMQAWGEILIEEACCNNNLNPKPKLRLALRLFKRAAEIAEDSHKMDYHRIHIAIGDTYLRLGQYSDAVDNYNTAVEYFDTATSKIEDKPFKLWACRAYALEKQGDKEYEKQINSDRELISHYIGACERKVNNIFHSSFKKTQNNSQEPATTYYEIAVCYALIHETQKAIENLKKALDCDKKNEIRKWAKSEIGFIKLKLNPEFQNLIKPKESLNLTTDKVDLSDLT